MPCHHIGSMQREAVSAIAYCFCISRSRFFSEVGVDLCLLLRAGSDFRIPFQKDSTTDSVSFYDNGLIGTDFGGGDGYRLYTLYQIGDALQLELVYRYAEWYRSCTTYYTEGEEAYEEGSRQASYETVLSEWNRLIGSAQIQELSFLKNTADSREQITMD